ncbi:hypothetical protein BT96DRAFT_986285 [Gymnopus androsaceus JB14]|uniref:Uncharacterized protein n=1 Tax=Gymnopus androsaceus JB14 TaxID=1447944 RepID=A0A6A4IC93_9AGAR|nr:hypothetical protein BT96DRAFT_986285 [Gymnopus androsaceus JB14]
MPFQATGTNVFRLSGAGASTGREMSLAWDPEKLALDMAKETDIEDEVMTLPGASKFNAGSVSPPPSPKLTVASSSLQSITSTPAPSSAHASSLQTPALTLKRSADNIFVPSSSKKAKGSEVLSGLLTEVVSTQVAQSIQLRLTMEISNAGSLFLNRVSL